MFEAGSKLNFQKYSVSSDLVYSKFQILFPYVYSIMRMNDAKQVIYEYN